MSVGEKSKHVRALFDYVGAAEIELNLKEGDIIKVITSTLMYYIDLKDGEYNYGKRETDRQVDRPAGR